MRLVALAPIAAAALALVPGPARACGRLAAVSIAVSPALAPGDPIDLDVRPEPGAPGVCPIRWVTATLWNGFHIDLGLVAGEPGWFAEVETPGDLSQGQYAIRIIAGDDEGHTLTRTVEVRVRARRFARAGRPPAG